MRKSGTSKQNWRSGLSNISVGSDRPGGESNCLMTLRDVASSLVMSMAPGEAALHGHEAPVNPQHVHLLALPNVSGFNSTGKSLYVWNPSGGVSDSGGQKAVTSTLLCAEFIGPVKEASHS
mmetsp:Transcript_22955/g.43169  ORF Transcript_22955/g.43169 Transcript_22955/m.43169 type:complete len:121 (+) Transcript_22955:164-526(+)